MPRLTNHDYLAPRHYLAQLWRQSDGSSFAALPAYARRDLHDFYGFTVPMSDEAALTHRIEMTAAFPSLLQSAGRALEALRAHLEGGSTSATRGASKSVEPDRRCRRFRMYCSGRRCLSA